MSLSRKMTMAEARQLGRLDLFKIERCTQEYNGEGIYVLDFKYGIKVGRSKCITERVAVYTMPWFRQIRAAAFYRSKNSEPLEKLIKRAFAKGCITNSSEFILYFSIEKLTGFIESNEFFIDSTEVPRIQEFSYKPKTRQHKKTEPFIKPSRFVSSMESFK